MENKRLPRKEFEKIFSKVPRACVELAIKNEKGILFTKRSIEPFKGTWHIPGGSILFSENLEETAKRVAKEELGVEVILRKKIGNIEYLDEEDGNLLRHSLSIVFLAEIISDRITLNHEADDFIFSKRIPEGTLPNQREFFEKHKELFEE